MRLQAEAIGASLRPPLKIHHECLTFPTYILIHWQSFFFLSFFSFFFFFLGRAACGILVPRLGIEPSPSIVKARSPSHCTNSFSFNDFN